MILEALITGLLVVTIMKLWQRFVKRPQVWIIDDCELEIMQLKVNLNLDDCDVRYFTSVKNLAFKMALKRPDAVIVDYCLKDDVDGGQVLDFCKRNCIPAILVTGYDGEIVGVDKSKILIKSTDKEYYRNLESWVHTTV